MASLKNMKSMLREFQVVGITQNMLMFMILQYCIYSNYIIVFFRNILTLGSS